MISKFEFCPNCKNKLKKTSNRLIDCPSCGFHFYFSPAATTGIILENERKEILFVKRKFPPHQGLLDLPGGFIEYNEMAEEAIKREIKEELGAKIKNLKYLNSYPDRYLYKGVNYWTLNLTYTGKIDEKKIIAADDISGIEFFSKNKIPWNKLSFSWIKLALYQFYRSKNSKQSG